MVVHELKSWPENFNALALGYKTAEVRLNDRDYHMGDLLVIRAWEPKYGEYLQRPEIIARITHIDREPGLAEGYVVLSLAVLK